MKLNTDLIYEYLSGIYQVEKYGIDVTKLSLNPPIFYDNSEGYRHHAIYICDSATITIPENADNCLFIISGKISAELKTRRCSILTMEESPPIYKLFNEVQSVFLKYESWIQELQSILDNSANIKKMTEITSVLMDECIGLCNKDLEMVLYHNPHPENKIDFVHLTADGIKTFWGSHARNTSQRVPFIFQREQPVYCLNVYKNEEYLGVLVLPEFYHKLTEGRIQLFNLFFDYLYKAIDMLDLESHNGLVNLKMVFRSILRGDALDEYVFNKVMFNYSHGPRKWLCLASKLSEPLRKLPSEFICQKIESADANIIAIEHDGNIAMLLPVRDERHAHQLPLLLVDAITNLLGSAGASIVFNNITNADKYYRQAAVSQQTALARASKQAIHYFSEYAFDYMLDNSIGEFTPKNLVPKELLALRKCDKTIGDIDNWDILKCYLDNEMSTSLTARELYIHRTTLQHRIDKITETLNLSDPKTRLYIHFCMYLYDSYESLITHTV